MSDSAKAGVRMPPEFWVTFARAKLEALREPTEDMVSGVNVRIGGYPLSRYEAARIWEHINDQALK